MSRVVFSHPCMLPLQVLMNPRDTQNKEITWRNAAALEGYVRRLSEVADRLAERNRQLRKWHEALRDKVTTAGVLPIPPM